MTGRNRTSRRRRRSILTQLRRAFRHQQTDPAPARLWIAASDERFSTPPAHQHHDVLPPVQDGGPLAPNLIVCSGQAHRLALDLKDDT